MNKLLILISSVLLMHGACAVSLGDTMNQQVAAQTNTTTSVTKLLSSDSKSSTFISTSTQGSMRFLVNNHTNKVYSISWQDKQAANLENVLGSSYYPEFNAAKTTAVRIPLRGIAVNDGNLSVSQFGSMLSGFQGVATVSSLAP